jgi:acetolactate synthase regulatory subunit
MQWLMALETSDDPISTCRLMNVFRRKGITIVTLTMAARPAGFSLIALVETPEAEVEHIFNFLRRTEGVYNVTYYRHEPSGDASFVFIDADENSSSVARFLQTFPESKLIFASQGKYLLEIPGDRRPRSSAPGFGEPEFLPFARVKTSVSHSTMVGAPAS